MFYRYPYPIKESFAPRIVIATDGAALISRECHFY